MKSVIFVICAYFTGVMAAVPAGPVQIEVVRRSLNGHLRSSLMVVTGAMAADVAYGIIAFFGIAPFLKEEYTKAVFLLSGAAVLIFLGTLVIRQSLRANSQKSESSYLKRKRWGLISGFLLSAANPVMILWWLIGANVILEAKLINALTPDVSTLFLIAGALGLASYLAGLSIFIFWAKKFIPDQIIQRINMLSGIILFIIAIYFMYSSLKYFIG